MFMKIVWIMVVVVVSAQADLFEKINGNMVRSIYGLSNQVDIEIDKNPKRVYVRWFNRGLCMCYLENEGKVAQTQDELAKMKAQGYTFVANVGKEGAYYKDDKKGGLTFIYNGVKYRLTAPHSVEDAERISYTTAMAQALINYK